MDFELAFGVGRHPYTDGEAIDGEGQGIGYLQGRPNIVCDNMNKAALGGRFTKEDGTKYAPGYSSTNDGSLYLVLRGGIGGVASRDDFRAICPIVYMRGKGQVQTLWQLGGDKFSQGQDKYSQGEDK